MPYHLATPAQQQRTTWLKRFDPAYWTVDFPRPMMAAATTTATGLHVDLAFYRRDDLAGLIWWSEDRVDHPLLGYETGRDYRRCTLRFRWRSSGVKPLDAVHGPTLTIEGRDAGGTPRSWYVRLWNYATGTPTDAVVILDFGALDGGFMLPGEAVPVWAGDIDRMFVSLVPAAYDATAADLSVPVEAWVTLDDIACDGSGSVLALGDAHVPAHGLSVATGYDDHYHVTPERLVRNLVALGYRGAVNHYVGMSHYFRLLGGLVTTSGGPLNTACAVWHADWAARLHAAGLGLIVSLSYELFDAHCPAAWKQRAANGDPALTGWVPPSTLLSPANANAMAYLASLARAFMALVVGAGQAPRFQIGEPWWWVTTDHRICLYDDAAVAAFAPVAIADVRGGLTSAQRATLDAAGAVLSASTAALFASARADHPACERLLLAYLPSIADDAAPGVKRANVPLGWASPAFDVLQLEDYDWVTTGNRGASARGRALATARLGYSEDKQHYLSGFVLRPEDVAHWAPIAEAAHERKRAVAATFVWALPQVLRDGFTYFDLGDGDVQDFDDVMFPLAIGLGATVEPGFSTAVVTTASGHEQRNADWASARMRYDAGPGVRSGANVAALVTFFRARRGQAKAFRFRDPLDFEAASAPLGTGDGVTTRFALVKRYGEGDGADAEARRITHPVPVSVRVAVNGVEAASGWSLGDLGHIDFAVAPATGAVVTASFTFDVPVRFDSDRLSVSLATYAAGEVPSVGLVEVRE